MVALHMMADNRSSRSASFNVPEPHLHSRQPASLGNDGRPIEDGGHDAVEVSDDRTAVCVSQLLWHNCPAQADARKPRILAEAACLNCNFLSTCTAA